MKTCDYCGRENDDEAAQCIECGTTEFKSPAPPEPPPAIEPPKLKWSPQGEIRSVASLTQDEASSLVRFLNGERIAATIQTVNQANGCETTEVLVEAGSYIAACDAAERWLAGVYAEEQRQSALRCPNCRSPNLERFEHDKLQYALRCKDCACLITYLSHE